MDQVYGKQLWQRQKGLRGEEFNDGEAWRAWSGVISVTIVDLHTSSSTIANTSINTNTNTNTATIDKIEMQNTIVVGCYFCGNRALPHTVLHAFWSAKNSAKNIGTKMNTNTIAQWFFFCSVQHWVTKIETQNTIVARCHFCDNAFKPNDRATDTSCEPRNTTLDSRS